MAIWAALSMPVMIGAAALSVDAARLYTMDHDLQSAADALAKAGAAELDQRPDSLSRATHAINTLISNDQTFGNNGAGKVAVENIRFASAMPSSDTQSLDAGAYTTVPKDARYVEVTVKPETVTTLFPVPVVNTIVNTTLSAASVASLDQTICGSAPVFVCNPWEGQNTTIYEALKKRSERRRLVQFKAPGGNNSHLGPGNFGYLDPFAGDSNGSKIRDAAAVAVSSVCVSKNVGVSLRPGNVSSMRDAFNTRFDMYAGTFKSKKDDANYAPAANVTRGYSGNACKETPDTAAMGLPRDKCFIDGTCSGKLGDGDWDFVEYVKVNHGQPTDIEVNGTRYYFDYAAHSVTPASIPTRYEIYRWEINTDSIPGALTYGTSSTPEEGKPQCHYLGASTSVEDRRVLSVAVLNCAALHEQGYSLNGRKDGLPVEAFAKMFMTEPMGKGQDNILWGEMFDVVQPGQDAVARDKVLVTR